ncbi:MAG: sodium/sulfate symporter [Rhodocyclaceae bacterium]|nr:MAG: sodium/sulfate symporter [Rhodocyclaceae bacterium]TND02569.1 MAG: sodium/sulfate symporter [Rhodocyclaceae bacterium]
MTSSETTLAASASTKATPHRDPLDMRNYNIGNFKEMAAGPWMARAKLVGVPLALVLFLYFQLRWCGKIDYFENAEGVKNIGHLYTVAGIFFATLVLWMTESIPSYLTSFLVIVATILFGVLKMKPTFAYLGEPVMILNIASFIMASALVVTGLAKRIALKLIIKWGNNLSGIFWAFIILNLILGAFISATSAKTALLLPLFMVISAMYGSFGGALRNNVGRNMVLQNLLANNVSASAFITGSAANLLAAQMLEQAGYRVLYSEWLMALLPLAIIQCAIAWYTGTKLILPISKEESVPHVEGGMDHLRDALKKLGPMSRDEVRASFVFVVVLFFWITESMHGIKAQVVAMCGAVLVLMPAFSGLRRFGVMNWNQADIPWHLLMFSWGAYVLGGIMEKTKIVDLTVAEAFLHMGITAATPKVWVFLVLASMFAYTTLVNESKTARTIILFPVMIATATQFGWDVVGFCLPMAFLINQVYVLYFNSKPANISYLTDMYTTGESFKFGFTQLTICIGLVTLWAQYAMPLMGFKSQLW